LNVVEIENVTKRFDEHVAVDSLSLHVPAGRIYGFIGPNGSGKTTTLRMIMNIFYPDDGTIRVFGDNRHGACSDRIGYLPEERGLYRKMKVRDMLRFYGGLKKKPSEIYGEVDRWLERLDLTGWSDKKIETLSKGMSQKVQFIATILSKPELIILDEPFAGLDPVNADIIRSAILELQKNGATVIFSTHDMSMAEKMCDFIFMIFKGKKVLDGTLSSIQEKYGHDTLRITSDGGGDIMQNIDGVEKVNDFGRMQELKISPDADPQKIAAEIMSRTKVMRFEIARPSLHDIFIRIAGPEAKEANNA
jgi:ABC-2 type transport system ATP-binding protein